MIRTAPFLMTALLLIAPGIGADAPDYYDTDGDNAAGPVGIQGVSVDSGDRTFRFDLHVDAIDVSLSNVIYTWNFQVGSNQYEWSCEAMRTYNGPALDCVLSDTDKRTLNLAQFPETGRGKTGDVRDVADGLDPRGDSTIPATHTMNMEAATVGFTLHYADLGLERGDIITLVAGSAHFTDPNVKWAGTPTDTMVLYEDVVLQ